VLTAPCHDLRDLIAQLQAAGELKRVSAAVSPYLEMAALKETEAARGFQDLVNLGSLVKTLWAMAPQEVSSAG